MNLPSGAPRRLIGLVDATALVVGSIDRARLRGRVQRLTGDEMDRVDEALRVTLALHASL